MFVCEISFFFYFGWISGLEVLTDRLENRVRKRICIPEDLKLCVDRRSDFLALSLFCFSLVGYLVWILLVGSACRLEWDSFRDR